MKHKRKVKKQVKILIVLIVILILLLAGGYVYKTKFIKEESASKVTDKIEGYDYVLEDNKPKIYKNLFKKLAEVLKEDDVDYEQYAKIISQMAVFDFYNLDDKVSKNDVGGVQFIRKENKENFILEASETVYKYIEQNSDGKRTQELPIVTKVEVSDIKTDKYSYQNIKDDNSYIVKVKLEYKKDLGYPKDVEVRLLHTDKKLEIYKMK